MLEKLGTPPPTGPGPFLTAICRLPLDTMCFCAWAPTGIPPHTAPCPTWQEPPRWTCAHPTSGLLQFILYVATRELLMHKIGSQLPPTPTVSSDLGVKPRGPASCHPAPECTQLLLVSRSLLTWNAGADIPLFPVNRIQSYSGTALLPTAQCSSGWVLSG